MNDTTPDESNSASLHALVQQVLDDGQLDETRIEQIERALKSDWIVDRSEIEWLFQINQKLGDRDEQFPQWSDLFVNNVARLVVMDLETPGEIDESEGDWLAEVFDQYSVGNATEKRLIEEIRSMAKSIGGRFIDRIEQNTAASAERPAE